MMSLRNWTASLGLAALAACGTVKGDDTMMGDDAPPVDTTPPQLMSSNPGVDATKVSIIAPLTFVFDESLDPATVNDAAVTVQVAQYNMLLPVTGVITYDDASKTVTFKPKLPLATSGRYYVHIAPSVKDTSGNAFAGKELAFNTNTNSYTRIVSYNTTNQTVQLYTQYSLDMNGYRSRYVYFDGTGPDQQWFTGDDVPRTHSEYYYSPTGVQLEFRSYDAGPDQIWNNGDDRIDRMTKYMVDSRGLVTGYTSINTAGPDNMWGTADDVLFGYSTTTYEPNLMRQVSFDAPGADGVWKTSDDRASSITEYKLDSRGYSTGYVNFSAGPDGLPKTTDDVVNSWTEDKLDANGKATENRYYNGAGPDGTWFTADDVCIQLLKYQIDSNGYTLGYVYYTAPGPDAMWGTADDVAAGRQSYTNDANGLMTTSQSYSGPGPDGIWATGDDVPSGYATYTYDQNGQRTKQKYYGSPGPDNVWRTGDDRVSSDYDFDVTH